MNSDLDPLWSPYFDISSDCVKILDTRGQILLGNPVALGIMGFETPPPGLLWPDGLDPRSRDTAFHALRTADRGQTAQFYGSSASPTGEVREWSTLMTPIDFRGATRVLSVSREMTSELEAFSSLLYRNGTDELTGVRNRRGVLGDLENLRRCADRAHARMAVLVVDVDGLKGINDLFGHAAGDAVIRATARRLQLVAATSSGVVGRIGGDEFVLAILGGYDRHSLKWLCDRVMDLSRKPVMIPTGSASIEVTTSFTVGATIYPFAGHSVTATVAHADHALIAQKQEKRGQARMAV